MGLCRLARTVCEHVRERWRYGAGSLPTFGIRPHRRMHTCLRGRSTRPIFDHRETVMGLCRLARTVCEHVRERWRDGAGSLPTFGIQSHRCLHPCFRGRSMGQLFDLGETVMGLCRLARTVCERVGERWRDGAGSLPTFGIQSYRRFAHMLARAVDAADFRPSRNGDGGCAGWRAQSARVSRSDGGTAQAVFVDCV
jgi:hypothetical protein